MSHNIEQSSSSEVLGGRSFPTANGALADVPIRDLPDPQPLRRVLGPGVIAAGVGLASGEFVLWPYISANVGLVFLWAMFVGVTLQFFINMEIERYTLATGETALTGFSRSWRHWGLVFAIMAALANMWPGWATSSATVLTFAIGGGNAVLIAIIELVVIGLVLTLSPVVYQSVEQIQFAKVIAVVIFMLVALFLVITRDAYSALPDVVTNVGQVPTELGFALVLGALAFAGGGGAQNLVQSNWIRDKNMGMGARIPRLVSPITGEDQAAPSTGFLFDPNDANLRRWRGWWKVANTEQLVSFVAITAFTITVTSLLAFSTVFGQDVANDVAFLQTEADVLNERTGWFGTFFLWIGAVSLFAAALGILDYVGRLVADVLKVNYLADSQRWTESRIYTTVVWSLIALGTIILLAGLDQPLVLLVIAAVLGGFMMFVYSILLIQLNRKALPRAIELRGYRLAVMGFVILFFGFFSALILIEQVQKLFA
ncbi:MAG: Nramp family divalent metal transporter [Geodermatophilaceae bacterium]